ncbi:hypothetical protein Bca4012_094701 [Brassica carinata]
MTTSEEGGAEAEVEALKRRWRRGRLVSVKLSVGFTYSPPSQVSSASYIFVIGFVFFTYLRSSSDETGKRSSGVTERVSG